MFLGTVSQLSPLDCSGQGILSQQWEKKLRQMQMLSHYSQGYPGPLLWSSCPPFPPQSFVSHSLVMLQLNHMHSASPLLLAIIDVFQTHFGFITLSLPETNQIYKLCFHLNSKEHPSLANRLAHPIKNPVFTINMVISSIGSADRKR